MPSPDLKQTALGLLPGHAYGVMQCIQVEDKKLVRLRNPWSGRGGTWKGPWADSSSQWEDFPEVLDECLKQARGWTREEDGIDQTDGSFFMEFSDFCSKFDTLHLCRLFDDKQYKQYKVLSSWAGKTAAGPDEGVPINGYGLRQAHRGEGEAAHGQGRVLVQQPPVSGGSEAQIYNSYIAAPRTT